MKRYLMAAALLVVAGAASAQPALKTEVFIGNSHTLNGRVTSSDVASVNGLTPIQVRSILGADIAPRGGHVNLIGAHGAVTRYFNDLVGLTAEFSGSARTEDATFFGLPGSAEMRVYQGLAGPQLRLATNGRVTLFARALAGAARRLGTYTNTRAFVEDRQTVLALATGGGIDVQARSRLTFRLLFDYNPVFERWRSATGSDATQYVLNEKRRDNARLSFGVVIR